MSEFEFIPVSSHDEIATVARLADEIWYQHYVPIIGRGQVEYMLAKFQSPTAIAQQIGKGMEYFLLRYGQCMEGYFAIERQPADQQLFLSKLYIRREMRGRGLARRALDFIGALGRADSLTALWLTVNTHNPAVEAYKQLGFRVIRPIVADIGAGYVTDDYRMERAL